MRVLLVTHNALPHHRAGVETYTHQLARELGQSLDVTVATTRKVISRATGSMRSFLYEGVATTEVINNLDGDTVESTWNNPKMEHAFGELLARARPDVVHFQHVMYWSSMLPSAVAAIGARCVFTLHDFFLMCARMGQLIDYRGESCAGPSAERCAPCMATFAWGQSIEARRWIRRLTAVRRATGIALDRPVRALGRARNALRGGSSVSGSTGIGASEADIATAAAGNSSPWREAFDARTEAYRRMSDSVDAFVTPSQTLRGRFIDWGIPAEKIHHVPQGLDSAPFSHIQRRSSVRLRLAFLGTVAPHKGVLDLVEAVRGLPEQLVELAIYGRTDQHQAYAENCRKAAGGAANIEFRGWLRRDQVPRAYEEIDVLCVPSRWDECAPLTIQEAFMAGVPCVVSGRGGLAELVSDGVDGLHARSGDVGDWTRVLRRLIDEPDLGAQLRAGIRPVPTVAEHAAGLMRIYRS